MSTRGDDPIFFSINKIHENSLLSYCTSSLQSYLHRLRCIHCVVLKNPSHEIQQNHSRKQQKFNSLQSGY